jgi:demethylmenaquinone methyltransferase/2-methoxy-6-polyprenyl-1,4-benzoquinol methylase
MILNKENRGGLKEEKNQDYVFCGSKLTDELSKKNFVNSVFSSVYKKYDIMNDLMSFGAHHIWKYKLIKIIRKKLFFKKNPKILDIASGSGDIPIKFLKKYTDKDADYSQNMEFYPKFVISDINNSMLEKAKERIIDNNLLDFCEFSEEDMTSLSFEDNFFDLCVVSFGVRNSSNIQKSFYEAFRVLKPYTYYICMEFSSSLNNKIIQKIYDLYSKNLIPFFGEKIANDRSSYEYLVESIKTFPNKLNIRQMLLNSGFKNIEIIDLNFGIVNIYIAQVIEKN